MDKTLLLESVLGRSIPAHGDNISFHCPFCNHPKPKLNVSLGSGAWGCWVCGQSDGSKSKGRSVVTLFRRLGADRDKILAAKSLWKSDQSTGTRPFEVNNRNILTLPLEYRPLWMSGDTFFHKIALQYAKRRRLTDLDIVKYRVGYCSAGRYANRIILPSFDVDGSLNFFSGRSWLSNPALKFLIPDDMDKDIITYGDQINWSDPVILVESQLDAITIRRNAIPLNGKSIRNKLRQKIVSERVPKVVMCFDGDAHEALMQQSRYFINNGIPVYRVDVPFGSDPNSLGYDSIWKMIDNSVRIRESENFIFQVKTLLNGK